MKYISFTFLIVFFAGLVKVGSVEAVVLLEGSIIDSDNPSPEAYLSNLYRITVGFAAVLAVVMIVWGGIEYIASAANPSAKENAKKRIWAAIGGLLLALLSFLILQTINPSLVGGGTPNPHGYWSTNADGGEKRLGIPGACTESGFCYGEGAEIPDESYIEIRDVQFPNRSD